MNILLILVLGISLLYESCCQAVVIGSNDAVSIITTSTLFPAIDTDNTMLGFGWFQGGFTLQDATTTVTFNSVYPVSGIVNMNGGRLYLLQDVVLANPTQLAGLGTIIGNGHSIEFCESITALPANLKLIKDLNLFFNNNIELTSTLTIQGNCFIDANSNIFSLSDGAHIIVDTGAQLWEKNEIMENVNNNITCVDDTSTIVLENVTVKMTGDTNFLQGGLLCQGLVKLAGEFSFSYNSANPCTIDTLSTLCLDNGITLLIGKQTVDSPNPLVFNDNTSMLQLGECTLVVTASGLSLQRGRLALTGEATMDMVSSDTMTGLILGDGLSADNDITIYLGPGSFTTFNAGAITYNNVVANRFYSSAPSACMYLRTPILFYVQTTCTLPECIVQYEYDGTNFPHTYLSDGAQLYYNNTDVYAPGYSRAIMDARRTGTVYNMIFDSNDSMNMTNGAYEGDILVVGSDNVLTGIGEILGTITLNDLNSSLILAMNGYIMSTISLNNGMLILMNNIAMLTPNCFTSRGIINLQSYQMTLEPQLSGGSAGNVFNVPLTFVGNYGQLNIATDIVLSSTWTVSGIVTINGNGNALNFEGGALIVAPNSQLTIQDCTLNNFAQNIVCMDNTGSVVLKNVTAKLATDIHVQSGGLLVQENVNLTGNYTFWYDSANPCTIDENSVLHIDGGISFQVGKQTPGSLNPLVFNDSTSILSFGECALTATGYGLSLLRGRLEFDQKATIDATSTDTMSGIILGDGISEANDITIYLGPGSYTTFSAGALTYNNVIADRFYSAAPSTQFYRMIPSVFYMQTTCTFPECVLQYQYDGTHFPPTYLNNGAELYYNNTEVYAPGYSRCTVNGRRAGVDYELIFDSNDSMNMTNGVFMGNILVNGSNNIITGIGEIQGTITLNDQSASLILAMSGYIMSTISLNNGMLILMNDITMIQPNSFTSSGIINLQNFQMTLDPQVPGVHAGFIYITPLTWVGNNGHISLASDTILSGTWAINGKVMISGNGNKVTFAGGALVVAPHSQLTIQDCVLENFMQNSIVCADNTSSLILKNVNGKLATDMHVQSGSLLVQETVNLTGNYTFWYDSALPCTIDTNSILNIDGGISFSDRQTNSWWAQSTSF